MPVALDDGLLHPTGKIAQADLRRSKPQRRITVLAQSISQGSDGSVEPDRRVWRRRRRLAEPRHAHLAWSYGASSSPSRRGQLEQSFPLEVLRAGGQPKWSQVRGCKAKSGRSPGIHCDVHHRDLQLLTLRLRLSPGPFQRYTVGRSWQRGRPAAPRVLAEGCGSPHRGRRHRFWGSMAWAIRSG